MSEGECPTVVSYMGIHVYGQFSVDILLLFKRDVVLYAWCYVICVGRPHDEIKKYVSFVLVIMQSLYYIIVFHWV